MSCRESFADNCRATFIVATAGQAIDRRKFLAAAALLGISPAAFKLTPASAETNDIVIASWGGDDIPAWTKTIAEPFNKTTGLNAVVIGGEPSSGKIRAMVDSGHVIWDLCDRNLEAQKELGRDGYLEPIDYAIVDKSKVRPGHAREWGYGSYFYSHPLVFDRRAFGDNPPKTWKDFWNVKDFPGKRTIRKHIDGMLEPALLADGVPPEKLYPLDVKRALAKINEIKEHTIFWGSGSESQQVFREREVTMGILWSTKAIVLRRESKRDIDFTYNQASLWVGAWIVPKGNPAGKNAMKLIASTTDPKSQVEIFDLLGMGPINPAASALLSKEVREDDPGSPENFAVQIEADYDWYADNSSKVLNQYVDLISS
jgi:putative spermidine/putrescine transport system substrate-binding protein